MNAPLICLHFVAFDGSRCMIGREAPEHCIAGCSAYLEEFGNVADADADEQHRRAVWYRAVRIGEQ